MQHYNPQNYDQSCYDQNYGYYSDPGMDYAQHTPQYQPQEQPQPWPQPQQPTGSYVNNQNYYSDQSSYDYNCSTMGPDCQYYYQPPAMNVKPNYTKKN